VSVSRKEILKGYKAAVGALAAVQLTSDLLRDVCPPLAREVGSHAFTLRELGDSLLKLADELPPKGGAQNG